MLHHPCDLRRDGYFLSVPESLILLDEPAVSCSLRERELPELVVRHASLNNTHRPRPGEHRRSVMVAS